MSDNKYILVLDHDGIIHPNELLEEYVKEIDIRASNTYRNYLIQLMEERELSKEKFDLLIMEHYFIKDQVLEEVKEKFKNKIPYELMYTIDKAYQDVVKTIQFIYNSRAFDEIILNSHTNCDRERTSKEEFHAKYLDYGKRFYPAFHQDPFNEKLESLWANNDRKRTNKGIYLMKQLNVPNLKGFYAVDDSLSICREYEKCGAKAFYKDSNENSVDTLMRAACCAFDDRIEQGDLILSKGAYIKKR